MVSWELQFKLLGSAFSRVIIRDQGVHHMLTFFRIFELSGQPEDMSSKESNFDISFYLKHHGE